MRRYVKCILAAAAIIFICNGAGAEEAQAPSADKSEVPMTWADCVKEAAKYHPDLVSAQQSIKSSQADKSISAGGLFPQISADLNASKSKSSGGSSSSDAVNNYNYGLTGNQLIFDGFQTINKVNAAAENIKASHESYKFTSSQVRLRLRAAFVNLLKAQESLSLSEEIFRRRRQNFELVTLKYEGGIENKGSFLTEQANLRQAQYDITAAGRAVEFAQRQLTKELGRLEVVPITAKGGFTVQDPAREKPDFIAIAANNPRLLQSAAQKNAAAFNVKTARGEFLPTITAQGGADKSDTVWPPEKNQWSIGAAIAFPIFEGGKRFADISKAGALLTKAEADERSNRDAVIETLTDTWTTLQNSLDNVDVQYQFLIAGEERARIAEVQYSIGFVSFNDWLIIENELVSAKNAYLNARAQALLAEANWIQAKGETLENVQ